MTSPRLDLADRLADAGPASLTVFAEEPSQPPALPAFVVRPGSPYRGPAMPPCRESWRLEILALVPIDAALPLDDLDVLISLARDVIEAMPYARYNGVRQAPRAESIANKPMRAAIIELDVDI